MNEIKCIINGRVLDTYNEPIQISKGFYNFENPTSFEIMRSSNIKLPLTNNNKSILGIVNNIASNVIIPYTSVPCVWVQNGVDLFNGFGRLTITECNTDIECVLTDSSIDLFNELKNNPCSNLLSSHTIPWINSAVSGIRTWEDIWVYPICQLAADEDYNTNIAEISASRLMPAIYVKYLFSEMFPYLIWKNEPENFDKLLITINGVAPDIECPLYDVMLGINSTTVNYPNTLIPYDIATTDASYQYNTGGIIKAGTNGLVDIGAKIEVRYDATVGTSISIKLQIIKKNGSETLITESTESICLNGGYVNLSIGITDVAVKEGDCFICRIATVGVWDTVTYSTAQSYFEFDNYRQKQPDINGFFSSFNTLNDISQIDLLKEILFSYGATLQVINGAVQAFTMKDVYDNINKGNIYDWSDLLIEDNDNIEYRPDNLAQTNNLVHQTESDNPKYYKGVAGADSSIACYNTNLNNYTDLFTSMFGGCVGESAFTVNDIPQIPFLKYEPYEYAAYDGIDSQAFKRIFRNLKPRLITGEQLNTAFDIYFIVGNSPVTYNSSNDFIFGQTLNSGFSWFYENYLHYNARLFLNFKRITVKLRINKTHFDNFDNSIPIYLKKYNAYFFCEKIKNYKNDSATTFRLIKM